MRSWRASTSSSTSSERASGADLHHDVTYEHPPQELAIAAGDTITLSLPDKPTTGFVWEPAPAQVALRLVAEAGSTASEPRGAEGRRTMTFEVVDAAAHELSLVLRRRWEREPRETFTITLRPREH
jgi:predicted secreted protein